MMKEFNIDTKVKIEALNYETLINTLNYTDKRLEPLFIEFAETCQIDIPMDQDCYYKKYASFFKVDPNSLIEEYKKVYKAFLSLKEDDEIIKKGSYDYPPLLEKTKEAPRFLYIRGKKSLLFEDRTVAIVGSRQASEKSKISTRSLTDVLGENGITIVSGLAKGIDVTAHAEALKKGFNTIAVIGTHLNQYYPEENKATQLEIEKKGLVISPFSPARQTQRWFFPLRNGVMSGLSLATIIMEAGETSGALKQADYAMKQGRQVMIPESAMKLETIKWPRKYVEKGAIVVNKTSDVIEVLAQNNIFRVNEPEPIQQTLMDYLVYREKTSEPKKKDFVLDWYSPVLVEG